MNPQLVLLAGPNGAGKSTYYDLYLRKADLPFLNADLVAADTGIDSFAAARVLDAIREGMIDERRGFITETVFSDPAGEKLAMLRKAVAAGYDVTLIYVGLKDAALSNRRVEQRTKRGGHDVPRDKLAGRFERSLVNLEAALAVVPTIKIYDNSSATDPYRRPAIVESGAVMYRATGTMPRWMKGVLPAGRRRSKR